MKKLYHVFIIDLWNNITEIGHFTNLDDAIPGINNMISNDKWKIETGDIREYPSTFSAVFDTNLYDIISCRGLTEEEMGEFEESEESSLQIRGFIYDFDEFKNYINNIK